MSDYRLMLVLDIVLDNFLLIKAIALNQFLHKIIGIIFLSFIFSITLAYHKASIK